MTKLTLDLTREVIAQKLGLMDDDSVAGIAMCFAKNNISAYPEFPLKVGLIVPAEYIPPVVNPKKIIPTEKLVKYFRYKSFDEIIELYTPLVAAIVINNRDKLLSEGELFRVGMEGLRAAVSQFDKANEKKELFRIFAEWFILQRIFKRDRDVFLHRTDISSTCNEPI